jgi:preprotein translocase subunit SecG
MLSLIAVLSIIVSVALIFVVLVQNPKGGGIASNFGAPNQLGGAKRTNDIVDKSTWTLAATLGALALVAVLMGPKPTKKNNPEQQQTEQQDPNQAPNAADQAP